MSDGTRALIQESTTAGAKCKNGHPLKDGAVPGKWGCDGCGGVNAAGSIAHSCRTCNVDFCTSCADGMGEATKILDEGKSTAELIALPSIYTRHGKKMVNWVKIKSMLPYDRSEASVARRKELWKLMDMNGNGYASLAEVDKALQDVFQIDEIFNCKPVIMRAFNAAKGIGQGIKPPGWEHVEQRYRDRALNPVDYIEKNEFRVLIIYLHEYTALRQLFDVIDSDNDQRVTFAEFQKAVPLLRQMGQTIASPEATFKEIDADHGGMILFQEFSDWCLKKNVGAQIARDGHFE